ncbi:hypothetical protein NP493_162g05006 [Ridgeia piscesae]|uniref:Uncharacterized protein n=1 Tax=Ridgeia piscesae TaxID=27915 RepID=A0AAD9P409_RIDPI|nr:hypothetical protein NP493_162g05006 [Ridgeia piscesae]
MTLCHQVERLTSNLERVEKEVAASKSTSAEMLMENKSSWAEERLQLQTRISELDGALMKATTRLTNYISTEKRKKKKIAMALKELKARNKMQQAKVEQLETENQMLKWSIAPSGDRLKKQLRDLWRHHQEFNSIILSGYKCSSMVPGAEIDLTSIAVPYKSPSGVKQKDLEHLKERLDQLDDIQRHQLNKLRGFQDGVLSETAPMDNSQVKESAVTPQ